MSAVYLPLLNPIRLVQQGSPFVKRFAESMADFEDDASYCQPFIVGDIISFQFSTPITAPYVYAKLVDTDGNTVFNFTRVILELKGGLYYYQYDLHLTSLIREGVYYVTLEIMSTGFQANFQSEPLYIYETDPGNTVKIKYSHDQNDFGVLFIVDGQLRATVLEFRVEGGFLTENYNPASKDAAFINQNYDVTILNSIPYVTQKLTLGNGYGIPFWMADKINRIFSCIEVQIDGVYYSKLDGAKMEGKKESIYPMAWWTIDLIRKNNTFFDEYHEITLGGDFSDDFNNDFNNQGS